MRSTDIPLIGLRCEMIENSEDNTSNYRKYLSEYEFEYLCWLISGDVALRINLLYFIIF